MKKIFLITAFLVGASSVAMAAETSNVECFLSNNTLFKATVLVEKDQFTAQVEVISATFYPFREGKSSGTMSANPVISSGFYQYTARDTAGRQGRALVQYTANLPAELLFKEHDKNNLVPVTMYYSRDRFPNALTPSYTPNIPVQALCTSELEQ